ncbi:flagellar biosynthesis protein FlhB [Nitrosophilus kaiyonis]|uniref:flagellar biosynthesis protein FlhB n=1 Tax=Nitrosophilus kaiyonis TaxID=2930200 RepID=UPI002492F77F|nr:flagellar biosynthesis protein FlhB [Nitrosophilus kaiyonis]
MAKDPSKTEKATPRRREKAREEGQVAKSQDIPISASLLVIFLFLIFYFPFAYDKLYSYFTYIFSNPIHLLISQNKITLQETFKILAILILPPFLTLLLVGFISNVAQFGFLFTLKPLTPKLDKLNPISGLQRLFSLKTLFELLKNLLKLTVATIVAYYLVKSLLEDVFKFSSVPVNQDFYFLIKYTLIMILAFAILSIPISVIDYFFRKHEYEENIKMSKHEVKEEQKLYEGNPQIKSAIRKKQREMSLTRMMAEVAKADIVITNPTHYAVALSYKKGQMQAPKVVAKGKDNIALKIKEKAKELNIPIEENPPLARSLYESCEIGDFIPENLYKAIAKILAKIYMKKSKKF